MIEDNEKDVIEIAVLMALFFATTVLGFGAPPVYTIVAYPVSEVVFTGICMKMFEDKNRPVKKNNLRLRFARGRCVPGACCRRRRLRLSSPPPPMAVDDVRLRMSYRD